LHVIFLDTQAPFLARPYERNWLPKLTNNLLPK